VHERERKRVCMCVRVCVVCVFVSAHLCLSVYICLSVCLSICLFICLCARVRRYTESERTPSNAWHCRIAFRENSETLGKVRSFSSSFCFLCEMSLDVRNLTILPSYTNELRVVTLCIKCAAS